RALAPERDGPEEPVQRPGEEDGHAVRAQVVHREQGPGHVRSCPGVPRPRGRRLVTIGYRSPALSPKVRGRVGRGWSTASLALASAPLRPPGGGLTVADGRPYDIRRKVSEWPLTNARRHMVQTRARRLPAEKRRRQIIDTAREAFAAQGYARVGTADIARAAGISEPALYKHFAGKKELFVATLRATAPRLLKIWEEISVDYEDPIESLWAIGVYYYDHLESHAANMKLQFRALSETDDPDIRAALHDNFEAFVSFVA